MFHAMKKKLHKKSGRLEYLILNLFIFGGIGLLSFLLFNVSVFNPFTQAFRDFTITDLYYSQVSNQNKIYNGPLVLVNVEKKERAEIAFLLERLQEGHPRVIGLDIIFRERKKDTAADIMLKEVFAKYNNIVFPYIAGDDDLLTETRNNEFFKVRSNAFINVLGADPKFSTIRYYYPVYNNKPHFTTAMMKLYDPSRADVLFNKGQHKTEIRYYGNLQNFNYYTLDEVMDLAFDTAVLKDKIVLLGYMGREDGSISSLDEDRLFTPLNPRLSGRSYPDMYGAVFHANVIRMALDKDYIYTFPTWLNLVLAFVLTWLLLPVFVKWYVHRPLWYHLWLVLAQLGLSIFFVFLTIVFYTWANIKIEPASLLVAILFMGDFLLFYHHIIKYFKHKLNWNIESKFFEGAH